MKHLLVVTHSRSGQTARLRDAVCTGARAMGEGEIELVLRPALDTTAEEVLAAQAVLLGTPENFGYMSGGMKDFFDRIYYPCLEHTAGLPYGLFIKAGNDGRGALAAIERIVTGLRWRLVLPPVIVAGDVTPADLTACEELGQAMAAGLSAGIF